MIDHHTLGRLLLETCRINHAEYAEATKTAKSSGRSPYEVLLERKLISVDELVQAITIHLDIMLLKEAMGMASGDGNSPGANRPLGAYLERISMLFKTGVLLTGQKSLSTLVEILIREAPSLMNAERATIFLVDHDRAELYSHMGVGLRRQQIRIPWDSGIAGWVFMHGESLIIADTYNDPRFNREVDPQTGFTTKNLMCVPLRVPEGPVMGVFQVLNKRAGVFTGTDLEILELLASQAARSMENALEWDDLRKKARLTVADGTSDEPDPQVREDLSEIVGASSGMADVRSLIRKVAPTETTVMIQGESGTGKELVARAIRRLSRRATGRLVVLNCAAVPADLIESELFGHRKGSFTGAVRDHDGVFKSADKGTLFLDEVEAMSPALQAKLLRAIQTGEIKAVGGNVSEEVDVRLIAATNQDLAQRVEEGTFRRDLFYRLNVFPITIPPLRDRREDIPYLAQHFVEKISLQSGKWVRRIDPAALDLLTRYEWPGNVRELENEIERAHILAGEGQHISVRCLSARITRSVEQAMTRELADEPRSLKEAVETLEFRMIADTLEKCGGNRSAAAKILGLSRQGLHNKMHRYGIE